jgi:hypothetical protein
LGTREALGARRFGRQQIESGRTQALGHILCATHGAFDHAARILGLEIILRGKPAFKLVLLGTMQVKNFHDEIMT